MLSRRIRTGTIAKVRWTSTDASTSASETRTDLPFFDVRAGRRGRARFVCAPRISARWELSLVARVESALPERRSSDDLPARIRILAGRGKEHAVVSDDDDGGAAGGELSIVR